MKTKHLASLRRPTIFNQPRLINYVGLTALSGLALLGLTAITPVINNTASAETMTSELTTKTTAYLYSMISVALSNEINIDLTPKSSGSLSIGTAKLNVSTNNTTGYSIYLATVDGSNQLNPIDENQTFVGDDTSFSIKPLTGTATESNYLNDSANLNTWSYALTNTAATGNITYQGLKNSSNNLVYHTEATTSNDSYNLNIAVAVDASLPAGGYRNGIIVSAVANPISISGFKSIYYMQEMTPEICAEAKEHEEGQLVDKRDNKIYWVGKLKDGNCWMTQNLDLDLSTNITLTPDDTNIAEPWTPEVSTSTEIYQIENPNNTRQTPQDSYDPGNYVYKTLGKQPSSCDSYVGPSECPTLYADVSTYHPGFIASETTTIDPTTSTYDSHYHIGNFYEPNAYLAGKSDLTQATGLLADDICPKNWRLPTSVVATGSTIYEQTEWYKLVAAYGWDKNYERNLNWANFYYTPLTTSTQNIDAAPLYLARYGVVSPTNFTSETAPTRYAGGGISFRFPGSGKSSTATPTMIMLSGENYLYPGSAATQYTIASPVRCIAE